MTSEERVNPLNGWWWLRWAYRAGLFSAFAIVAFYVGPNRFLFHKWTRLAPEDFVQTVEGHCVPIVRRMKLFQREHGRLPTQNADIGILEHRWSGDAYPGDVEPSGYNYYGSWHHCITYNFAPGHEGWYVRGPFANGPIPCPPVALPPATRP